MVEISLAAAIFVLAVLGGRILISLNRRLNDHAERLSHLESVSRIQRKDRRGRS
jgi:hypothetical protein